MNRSDSIPASSFIFSDGTDENYYSFTTSKEDEIDTLIFFYRGSGCPSWKAVMPQYLDGFECNSRVFALNKRHLRDKSLGLRSCGEAFYETNNPEQWVRDYQDFILVQIKKHPAQNVVLVGVSEGVFPAVTLADKLSSVTHLVIIGEGGYTMRRSLNTLENRAAFPYNLEKGLLKISGNPRSPDHSWLSNTYRW